MYILELYQNKYSKYLVAFDSLTPGYTREKEDNIEYEYFNPKNIPDYMEIIFNENIVPLSRFMFDSEENVEIIWKEISNLSITKNKIIAGYSKIDAYVINNEEVKAYIEERETKYNMIKDFLESNGYEVERSFFGSEDGEAILYRKKGTTYWHFLCHLDPGFLDIDDLEGYVKEIIEEL